MRKHTRDQVHGVYYDLIVRASVEPWTLSRNVCLLGRPESRLPVAQRVISGHESLSARRYGGEVGGSPGPQVNWPSAPRGTPATRACSGVGNWTRH